MVNETQKMKERSKKGLDTCLEWLFCTEAEVGVFCRHLKDEERTVDDPTRVKKHAVSFQKKLHKLVSEAVTHHVVSPIMEKKFRDEMLKRKLILDHSERRESLKKMLDFIKEAKTAGQRRTIILIVAKALLEKSRGAPLKKRPRGVAPSNATVHYISCPHRSSCRCGPDGLIGQAIGKRVVISLGGDRPAQTKQKCNSCNYSCDKADDLRKHVKGFHNMLCHTHDIVCKTHDKDGNSTSVDPKYSKKHAAPVSQEVDKQQMEDVDEDIDDALENIEDDNEYECTGFNAVYNEFELAPNVRIVEIKGVSRRIDESHIHALNNDDVRKARFARLVEKCQAKGLEFPVLGFLQN
jgi:hypothetical protein